MPRDPAKRRYEIVWSDEAEEDFVDVRTFDQPKIRKAVDDLRHQAEDATRNRKPIEEPLEELPEATWQMRVGDLRVLYRVSRHRVSRHRVSRHKTVVILRVILKGTGTTSEAVRRGKHR